MSCNELPHIPETNVAITNRLQLVEFNKTYSEALGNMDTNLKEKLEAELPGILNVYLKGYRRLEEQGRFTESRALEEASQAYMALNNPVMAWMQDSGDFEERPLNGRCTTISINDAYEKFSDWQLMRSSKEIEYNAFTQKFSSSIAQSRERKQRKRIKVDGKSPVITFYDDLVLRGKTRSPKDYAKIVPELGIINCVQVPEADHNMLGVD